jgi:hypothetical protein
MVNTDLKESKEITDAIPTGPSPRRLFAQEDTSCVFLEYSVHLH